MEKRQCKVSIVPILWFSLKELKKGAKNTHQNLVKSLIKSSQDFRSEKAAESAIRAAVSDGLLLEQPDAKRSKVKSNILYSLPVVDKRLSTKGPVLISGNDWYCYECHDVNDTEMKVCECCKFRCFHAECVTSNLLQDEGIVNANKKRLTLSHSTANQSFIRSKSRNNSIDGRSEASTSEQVITEETLNEALQHDIIISLDSGDIEVPADESNGALEESLKTEFKKSDTSIAMKKETSPADVENDIKFKDVVFDKVVRPANPKLARDINNRMTAKPEVEEEMSDEEMMAKFCKHCRILKASSLLKLSTKTDIEELNFLLGFVFGRNKTWISEDMYSQSSLSIKNPAITGNVDLIRAKLVKNPINLKLIAKKFQANSYDQIDQLYCDFLDVSHNLAIIHGVKSAEHEASMFLLHDTLYEMSELKQCFDCYRHSNEKIDKNWFTRPCVPRHELVYAKLQGFNYWPAKVIRMIDGMFDVRFFGAQHSRALIEPNFVKAIDVPPTDQKHSVRLQTAIKELEKHQELLAYPVGTFSYATEKINRELAKQAKQAARSPPVKKTSTETPKTPTRKAAAENPKASTKQTPAKTPTKKAVAATKKKGDALETQSPPAKRQKVDKKLNGDQSINGFETKQLRSRSKSREPFVTVAKSNVETPKKRKIGVTKMTEDIRESPRKKGKNSLESQSNGKNTSAPQQNEADTTGSSLEFFDLTACESTSSDTEVTSSLVAEDALLSLRNKFKNTKSIEDVKQISLDALQTEIRRHQQQIRKMKEDHRLAILQAKNQEWCCSCGQESRFYCCWNTTYCSNVCQKHHWGLGHRKLCRRKK